MPPILEVRNLVKDYGSVRAVNGLSFQIPEGICFGLLGPNGAGKTTTIEIIEGIQAPSSGEVLFRGAPRDRHYREQIGVQFQSTALMDYLSAREQLTLYSRLYARHADLDELIHLCDLEDLLDRPHDQLSGGQRQRLLLALALINRPGIVFLDEPTTGLDPQSRRRFWELVNTIKARGTTVVLTTHYMDEAEFLCDDLVIIDHGQVIAQGSPRQLLRAHFPHVLVCLSREAFHAAAPQLEGTIQESDTEVHIQTHSVEETLESLIRQRVDLSSLRVHNPTLEDLFIALTGHALRN